MPYKHSINKVAIELRDQLSSNRRKLGFFFGAGSSMAAGVPGIVTLTTSIAKELPADNKKLYENLLANTQPQSIEILLNKIRTVRELIGEGKETIYGIEGKAGGEKLDINICKAISKIIESTSIKDMSAHYRFANWLTQNQSSRYNPIEVYTTNYDLLFEKALEDKRIPFFDGFAGSMHPFLVPESIEAENIKNDQGFYIPYTWIRLWKIHGSINWYLTTGTDGKKRIVRVTNKVQCDGDELMIYPSKQKYDESRRLPFLTYQDRLRKFLSNGECLLVVSGYSFSDEHLNEIIFQALRANRRLAVTALIYGEGNGKRTTDEKILKLGSDNPNFTVIGPDKGCIGGIITEWDSDITDSFYMDANNNLNLGDFSSFTKYLQFKFGIVSQLQDVSNEK